MVDAAYEATSAAIAVAIFVLSVLLGEDCFD